MTRRLGPPPLATRWLERRLAASPWRESILGDLDEEHAAITRRRSRLAADVFYCTQALRLPFDQKMGTGLIFRSDARGKLDPSPFFRGAMSELRLAIRSAFKHPGHTVLVVLALALGLGLNAAVYGIGDALLARPFPLPGVDRVVVIGDMRPGAFDTLQQNASPANFRDWQTASAAPGAPFARMAAWDWWSANITGGSEPERVQAFRVTPGFFAVMGVAIATGRDFAEGEDTDGRDRVVILSDGLWKRRFGGDRAVLGTQVMIEGEPHEVIGVAPEKFAFPNGSEMWVPLALNAEDAAVRRSRYLTVAARLKPGVTIDEARAHMAVVAARLKQEYPADNGQHETYVHTLAQGMGDPGSTNLVIVWQISALVVLLIACANVASLLLARGATRAREIAVRFAMGANRWRVIRQLLAESLVLAMLAVPLSLGLAWWLLRVIKSYMPARIANFVLGWHEIDLDGRVILFTIVAAIVTTAIFGLLPAIQASSLGGNSLDSSWYRRRGRLPRRVKWFRPSLSDTLKQGGRGSTTGRLRLRKMLVSAEMALALPLLVAAGMTALGTWRFVNGPQGYDAAGVLTFRTSLPVARYTTLAARSQFADQVRQALAALPGVVAAAGANVMPSGNAGWSVNYEIEGQPPASPDTPPLVTDYRVVTPSYFETYRMPLTRGRGFTALDRHDTLPVTIVSESFVARHWPNEDPLGKRVVVGGREPFVATVVGVAANHIHDWFLGAGRPAIFRPMEQGAPLTQVFAVRAGGDPAALTPAIRAAIARIDPAQPIYDVMLQTEAVRQRTIGPQYAAGMMALFGALALLLSVIGIYALVGYYVTQRRQEIGVRMALGAQPGDVVRLTVRQAGLMTAIGVGVGAVAAFALGRVLESAMFGIAQNDPRLLAGFAATLAVSALIAGYVPARRAAAIDPMVAMRGD